MCETLIYNRDNALKLLGYFGRSMLWSDWDERHPDFTTFGRGVMGFLLAPMELRMDEELLRLFPPKALLGITTPLQWRAPRT